MANSRHNAVSRHRRRLKQEGLVRLEVRVRKEDAQLVRNVATALADPEQAAETRALLRDRFAAPPVQGLKALLAAAPLDGIDLDREPDTGRDVAL